MGIHEKPTPSFNTVKNSNRKARRARRTRSRVALLGIFAVVALLLLTCLIFLIFSVVDRATPDTPDGQDPNTQTNTPGQPADSAIVYQAITQSNSAIHKGVLINVNESYAYEFPTTSAGLKKISENRLKYDGMINTYMVNGNNTQWMLDSTALDALNQMMYKYYELFEDGSTSVSSAYRTLADQEALNSSVKAGYSDHHTGYCVALKTNAGKSDLEADHWIYENCHKYGFIVRYPDSKKEITGVDGYEHCFRYVGVSHASYMTENNLCLEEYTQLLIDNYTKDKPLEFTAADGARYAVYYTAASNGDITTIQVSKNYVYTVSGDNMGGFIVTVHLDEPQNA